MVFGAFGEASEGVHSLVEELAEARLEKAGVGVGRGGREASAVGAKGVLVGQVRRAVLTVAVKAQAQCLLARLAQVGEAGRRSAVKQRQREVQEAVQRREQAAQEAARRGTAKCRGGAFWRSREA